jgi:hypothetical protein
VAWEVSDRDASHVRSPRGTAPAVLFLAAFAIIPVAIVAARGDANLHSRIQRLWALQISIQSDDPGRLAIEDAAADVEILEELLVPAAERRTRARKMYDSWHRRREWGIYEIDGPRIEYAENGDAAVARFVLKQSNQRERLRWACKDEWTRRGGSWYLMRRHKTLIDTSSVEAPRPLLP